MIARVLAVAAAASLAASTAGFHFPRDHYGPDAGIEWWYTTAFAQGANGHRYSIFFTLFKSRHLLLPVSQVVDLDTGAVVGHSDAVYPGQVGTTGSTSGCRTRGCGTTRPRARGSSRRSRPSTH